MTRTAARAARTVEIEGTSDGTLRETLDGAGLSFTPDEARTVVEYLRSDAVKGAE